MTEHKKSEKTDKVGIPQQALTKPGESDGMIVIPEELPVLTLRNTVLFPGSIVPLGIGRPKTVRLVEESIKDNGLVAVVAQRDPDVDDPVPADLYSLGCAARLVKLVKASKDNFSVVVQGLSRVRISEYTHSVPYLKARITSVDEPPSNQVEVEALTMSLRKTAREVLRMIPELPPSAAELLERVDDAGVLADLIASNVEASVEEKQSVLETVDLVARMRRVLELLSRQLEVLKLSNKISSQVKGEMSKTQREYYLRQQLKAIRDELGEGDDSDDDMAELETRVGEAQLPEEADKAARKELKRLRNMSPSQAEYTVARTYVEWLCDLPWSRSTMDRIDLKEVRDTLDADHYGLDEEEGEDGEESGEEDEEGETETTAEIEETDEVGTAEISEDPEDFESFDDDEDFGFDEDDESLEFDDEDDDEDDDEEEETVEPEADDDDAVDNDLDYGYGEEEEEEEL